MTRQQLIDFIQGNIYPNGRNQITAPMVRDSVLAVVSFMGDAAELNIGSVVQNDPNVVTGGAVYNAINSALSSAIKFQGITTTPLTDGSTQQNILIDGQVYTAKRGDEVIYGGKEFLWTGSKWQQLGDEESWALKTISITGSGYLTGGGNLEQNRTIDISATVKGYIDHGESAYNALGNYATITALNAVANRVTALELRTNWDDYFGVDKYGNIYVKPNGNTPRNFSNAGGVASGGLAGGGGGGGGVDIEQMWQSLKNEAYPGHYTDVIAPAHIPDMAVTYGYLKSADLSGYVTLNTVQTITATKQFTYAPQIVQDPPRIEYWANTNTYLGAIGFVNNVPKAWYVDDWYGIWTERNFNPSNYLPLNVGNGKTISGTGYVPIILDTSQSDTYFRLYANGVYKSDFAYVASLGTTVSDVTSNTYVNIDSNGVFRLNNTQSFIHSGGGTFDAGAHISLASTDSYVSDSASYTGGIEVREYKYLQGTTDGIIYGPGITFHWFGQWGNKLWGDISGNLRWGNTTIYNSGNFNPANYLPLSAGSGKALTGDLYMGGNSLDGVGTITTTPANANIYYKFLTDSRQWWVGVGASSGDDNFVIYDASVGGIRFKIDTIGQATFASSSGIPVIVNSTSGTNTAIAYQSSGTTKTETGWTTSWGTYIYDYASGKHLGIATSGLLTYNGPCYISDASLVPFNVNTSGVETRLRISNGGTFKADFKWNATANVVIQSADGNYVNIDANGIFKRNNSDIFYHSGNSNLTTVPWTCSTLTANGDIISNSANTEANIYFKHSSTTKNIINCSSGYLNFYDYDSSTGVFTNYISLERSTKNVLIAQSSGNVGIGTGNPAYKLDVNGHLGATSFRGYYIEDSGVMGMGTASRFVGVGETGAMVYVYGNNPFKIWTNGYARVTVDGAGNVGVGTNSPNFKLEVNGRTFTNDIQLDGFSTNETGIYFRNGFNDASTKYNCSILSYDHNGGGSSPDGITISGYDGVSICTGSNTRQERVRVDFSGNVGIGTTNPQYKLDVAGVIYTSQGVASPGYVASGGNVASSDVRLKSMVETVTYDKAKEIINSLYPKEWVWNEKHYASGKRGAGLIAQQVEDVLPFAIIEKGGYKYLNYDVLNAYEIALLQGHETRIDRLERENRELRKEIETLRTHINS